MSPQKKVTNAQLQAEVAILNNIEIRQANREVDHKRIVKLTSMSKFTSAFSSIMFSPEAAYEKGWIRVAIYGGDIVAVTCVRHKVREPKTVLYFLIVHPHIRGHKVGARMLKDLEEQTPHNCLKFNVSKENPDARKFYARHGYKVMHADAMRGTAWEMERSW